jgi:energy coupling factor transporter S component ThiW
MKTKKLTLSALLIATGVISSNIIYIPVGASKCFPVQHIVNVISAVLLGPFYAVSNAFIISLIRNMTGTGSILAFPGSMIGAFLAGLVFKKTGNKLYTVFGEVFGTGILGGLLSFPIAKFIMGKNTVAFFFIPPFLLSTIGGSILAYIILEALDKARVLKEVK